MAKHRRYPTKKTSKKDSKLQNQIIVEIGGDEFELPRPSKVIEKRNRRKNKPPSESMLDNQPTTWRVRELQELMKTAKPGGQQKRRRKFKNSLQEEAEKLGYQQRPWEEPKRLVNRINNEANKAINEELLKARFGKAGRDVNEIRKEYEAMDQKMELKKQRKRKGKLLANKSQI